MKYEVIRSNRKTMALQVTAEGAVLVRAPRRCSGTDIQQFVADHTDWILRQQEKIQRRRDRAEAFSLKEADPVSICGTVYPVHIVPGLKARLFHGQLLLPCGEMDCIRAEIQRIAREQGREWISQRLDQWAQTMGVSYTGLTISTARTRWGSCTRDGKIRISLWLLFAEERAIDYVLVHELSHRRHFDHSAAFWAEVGRAMPDYDRWRRYLRSFQEEPFLQSLARKGKNHA